MSGKGGLRGGPPPARRGRGRFRLKLPVIPPDALMNVRFAGVLLAAGAGFTLIALVSPNGLLTQRWAERARDLAGWATAPWCVVAFATGLALYRGRRSLRRAVAGRLLGATLLLLSAGTIHSLLNEPQPALPAPYVSTAAATDGQIVAALGRLLAGWFGGRGAVLVVLPAGVLGFGLLCGWSIRTWQRLGRGALDSGKRLGRWLARAATALWRAVRLLGRLAVASGRGLRAAALWVRQRYERWRIARAQRAEARAAARSAAARAAAQAALEAQQAAARRAAEAAPSATATAVADTVAVETVRHVDLPAVPGTVDGNAPRSAIQWQLPSTTMLSAITAEQISEAEINEKKRLIERTLAAFNVPVTVKEALIGPTVTQFSLVPAEGVSVKKIKAFESDLQLVLAAQTLRIELPIPGRPVVGIEIPNSGIATVGLREIVEAPQFRDSKGRLRLALGRDVDGKPRVGDLSRMPHVLIAGQTGSGKSGCVNSIIASLLFQCTPDELNLIMIDPKMVEMAEYEGIPHLKYPVVTDLAEAGKVLLWAVEEMERRYKLMAEAGYRNIDSYNKYVATAPRLNPYAPANKPFPYLVIIIDELADLMMFAPDDVEPAICRLTAKARAVGIHLVVATQRPSVNVVTGLIKANMPSRIAFAVASQIDSRVILDMGGAETLLGRGDMLYLPHDIGKPVRVQGTWVNDEEISGIIHHWRKQGSPHYVQKEEIDALMLKQEQIDAEKDGDHRSPLLERAIALLQTTNYASVSFLQRKLGIGYPRAARLMDDLEERGMVEPDEGNGRQYRVVTQALAEVVEEPEPVESAY